MTSGVVYGVDFSGASRAGENIWVTEAVAEHGALTVRDCGRADDFLADYYDSDPSTDRGPTLAALAAFVRAHPDAAFGFDFPFSVPGRVAAEAFGADSWRAVVAAVADCEDADAFAEACVEGVGGDADDTYLKRDTDREHGAFSPSHFFVQHQTYHGITGVLAAVADVARVVPFDALGDGGPVVAETYPAGVLDALGLHREGYKGTDDDHRTRRRQNLDGLAEAASVTVPDRLRETYLDDHEGDALDSLLAAVAVFRNRGDWGHDPESLAGRIYV
ncbi:DUF429 domain-containing protein [Halobacterium jilantaiense]|uniref:DUF429 domain-containing protein n=1 Tax=Halobacterium jilantaiense TaxID=355548 RepID=A0A1I0NYQ2_9EURY|nr:DUF429 domain-containing protein [Halobacterium jilantaiense]SEW06941.1 Protein of unknown function [Halobacterium jilantaiense]